MFFVHFRQTLPSGLHQELMSDSRGPDVPDQVYLLLVYSEVPVNVVIGHRKLVDNNVLCHL